MAIGFGKHNHARCIKDALAVAEDRCAAQKLQFTKIRRRVLEILLAGHKTMGAYEILDELAADGHKAQPPVAYRALEFLVTNGFAHKVEKRNAYIACSFPQNAHTPAFLICRACDEVVETCLNMGDTPPRGLLGGAALALGFQVETAVLEASGLCPGCQEAQT